MKHGNLREKIEKLKQELKSLKERRKKVVWKRGREAEDNKDLRENFAWESLNQEYHLISAMIHNLLSELEELEKEMIKLRKKE